MKPFSYHHFDLRQLVSFAEIARTGSFRQAAKTLYVAQPALSRQIKKLETALEVSLFDRAPHRLHLTPKDANWPAVCRLSFRRLTVLQKRFDLQALEEAAICASASAIRQLESWLQSWSRLR